MAFRRVAASLVLAIVTALGATVGAGTQPAPTVPPFPRGSVSADATPAWSPDDREIAYMTLPPGPLFVVASGAGVPRQAFSDAHHYATPAWSHDGRRLAFTSDRDGAWAVWSALTDGSDARPIARTPFASVYAPAWSPDGTRILFSAIGSAGPKVMLAEVGPRPGQGTRLVDGWRPRWSPDGRRIAYTDRFRETGQEREAIAVCGADGAAPRRLRSVVVPFSSPHLAADWSPDGSRLVVPRRTATGTELLAVDPDSDTATRIATVEGSAYDPAWSHDGTRIAYSSVGSDHPGELHVVSVAGGSPLALTQHPRGVKARAVDFAGADGVRVPAWLYEPPGAERRAALVWVHGGWPGEGTLTEDYDRGVQYFAAQGYVVLAPAYRGTIGYGNEIARITSPATAVADLLAAGGYLRTRPSVDPARIGIVGFSAGGMWTMLSLGTADHVFGAAVDFFGPTDLVALYEQAPQTRPLFERLLGPLEGHEADYRRASPVSYAGRIKVPMLILHGAADRVIPLDQSIKLVEALRAAGRPPQFRQFTGGHGFEGAEEADAFETTAAFLADHLRVR